MSDRKNKIEETLDNDNQYIKDENRREFLKSVPLWVAGHFVLLNGVIFGTQKSAEARSPNCGKGTIEDTDCNLLSFHDWDCGRKLNKEGTNHHSDEDCGRTTSFLDNDCAKQNDPNGSVFEDNDCTWVITDKGPRSIKDSDCGKLKDAGPPALHYQDHNCIQGFPMKTDLDCGKRWDPQFYNQDQDCGEGRFTTTDSACGLKFEDTKIEDNDCGLKIQGRKLEDSITCGDLNPDTGWHLADNDCDLNSGKFFNPPKPDLDCGKPNGVGTTWPDASVK